MTDETKIEQVNPKEVCDPSDFSVFTEVSWRPNGAIDYEQWEEVGHTLQQIHRSTKWWIGDWLNHGDRAYGEKYTQAIEDLGISKDSLIDYAYVARQVHPDIRTPLLSWSCHKAVAPLQSTEDQEHWLNVAVDEGLDTRLLRFRIRKGRTIDLTGKTAVPDGANSGSSNGRSPDSDGFDFYDPADYDPESYDEAAPFDMPNVNPVIKLRTALADLILEFESKTKDTENKVLARVKQILKETGTAVIIEGETAVESKGE